MQARFLLGPAGSGKTFRCVEAVRAELSLAPDGPPLIVLAPKQATFQIERQLLGASPSEGSQSQSGILRGYTRLHILSFERLAAFVLARSGKVLPETLTEEGRVMVLRALLARHHADLKVFRATARLTGFATQLSSLLRELQRNRVSAAGLVTLADKVDANGRLEDKLHDLSFLLERYEEWLLRRQQSGAKLDDANRLLDMATDYLRSAAANEPLGIAGMWLDGFAEMTPQETELVAALVPHCKQSTLAFCLDAVPSGDSSWLSPWTVVGKTFAHCHAAVAKVTKADPEVEIILRDPSKSRFHHASQLFQLEQSWVGTPDRVNGPLGNQEVAENGGQNLQAPAVRLMACPDAESEASLVAREIRRHAMAGGRYRDCAVLVRSLDNYHDVLRRALERYEIPFFLDRREPVAHHPLAELTRYALRTVAFDWRQEDWLGVLKSGLAGVQDIEVDWLENEALKRGWEGSAWREPLDIPEDATLARPLEEVRERVMHPFLRFASAVTAQQFRTDGAALANAIVTLWQDLKVEKQLEEWTESAQELGISGEPHGTVMAQLDEWVASLERAFEGVTLSLREWLPVIEAGFAGMTVGVIPPSLDQVLVGSVDRSRNPDLQKVFILGVNEGVFPAPPSPAVLLTDSDRLELEVHGVSLGTPMHNQLGHERYFAYIAFTRARQQLVVTWAERNEDGMAMNPSPFVSNLQQLLPGLEVDRYSEPDWADAVHPSEFTAPLLRGAVSAPSLISELPELSAILRRFQAVQEVARITRLSNGAAGKLYGNELNTSVSALEDFAACPFRFFAARGLRAEERDQFDLDSRRRGSFQHEVLQRFHEHVRSQQRQWRDLTADEARKMIREIGHACAQEFQGGLLQASEARRFEAGEMIGNLEQLLSTLVGWARQYAFDPAEVEVSFGLPDAQLPAWTIPLANGRQLRLRGRVDRVDVCRVENDRALLVICDYKSSGRQMDDVKIESGLELQLLSYLAALSQMPEARSWLKAKNLEPAGVFYVPLRGRMESTSARIPVSSDSGSSFQHRGRFDAVWLEKFDIRGGKKGEQFKYSLKKDGSLAARGNDALPAPQFPALVSLAEKHLMEIGERIFGGDAAVSPYRHKQQTACDLCAYRAVCRFDPWTMPYRSLSGQLEEQG